jgi:hypothetical protein
MFFVEGWVSGLDALSINTLDRAGFFVGDWSHHQSYHGVVWYVLDAFWNPDNLLLGYLVD